MARRGWLFLIVVLLSGCDKGSAKPPAPVAPPSHPTVTIRPITPLLPRLQTHLALDTRGNIYWVQQSDPPLPGGDLVFVMGEGGVPQTLPALNVEQILATLDLVGGDGAISSMTIGPDNQLYVLFTGTRDRTVIFSVLRYAPLTRKLSIAAHTERIMDVSHFGPSVMLARGTLLGSREALWLWLRHSDNVALLKLSQSTSGILDVQLAPLIPPPQASDLRIAGTEEDLSLSGDGPLYFIDRQRGTLWKIATDGQISPAMSLAGVSRGLIPPAGDLGHLYFLAGAGEKFTGINVGFSQPMSPLSDSSLHEPVLYDYKLSDKSVHAIDRSDISAPTNLPLQSLQPRQLLWDSATGTLVTFDAASGEILRLRIQY